MPGPGFRPSIAVPEIADIVEWAIVKMPLSSKANLPRRLLNSLATQTRIFNAIFLFVLAMAHGMAFWMVVDGKRKMHHQHCLNRSAQHLNHSFFIQLICLCFLFYRGVSLAVHEWCAPSFNYAVQIMLDMYTPYNTFHVMPHHKRCINSVIHGNRHRPPDLLHLSFSPSRHRPNVAFAIQPSVIVCQSSLFDLYLFAWHAKQLSILITNCPTPAPRTQLLTRALMVNQLRMAAIHDISLPIHKTLQTPWHSNAFIDLFAARNSAQTFDSNMAIWIDLKWHTQTMAKQISIFRALICCWSISWKCQNKHKFINWMLAFCKMRNLMWRWTSATECLWRQTNWNWKWHLARWGGYSILRNAQFKLEFHNSRSVFQCIDFSTVLPFFKRIISANWIAFWGIIQ